MSMGTPDGAPTGQGARTNDEAERLAALSRYDILDTPPDPVFEDIARLAAQVCRAPAAMVGFIAAERQWLKAQVGLDMSEVPIEFSVCARTIRDETPIVPDLRADPRFASNPFVAGEAGLRFYAGAPLETEDGIPIGTVCVLDTVPRPDGLEPEQLFALEALARQVMTHLERRRALAERDRAIERQARVEDTLRLQGLILDSMTEGVSLSDETGTILYTNAAEDAMFGYGPGELAGRHVSVQNAYEPDENERIVAGVIAELKTRGAWEGEWRNRRKDGSEFVTASRITAIRHGGNTCWLCVQRDVTEAKQAIARLDRTERRLAAILDNASVSVLLTDENQHCAYMNAAAERLTGYSFAETRGRTLHDVVHHTRPDGSPFPLHECPIGHAFSENVHMRGEETFVRRDGSFYPVRFAASPIRDAANETVGTIIEVQDISGEKAAEAALLHERESARAFAAERSAILGQLAEGVIVADAAGRISFVNEAAARLHGVARLDVEPDDYSDTYHLFTEGGEPYPPRDLPLARAVAGETVAEARWRIRRPDGGEILAVGSARPVLGPSGTRIGAVLTVRDDTIREAAERALRASEARFRAAVDAVEAVLWTNDAAGAMDGEQPGWAALTGQSRAQYQGYGWAEAVHPEDAQPTIEAWNRAVTERRTFVFEHRVRRRDGAWRRFSIRAIPTFDAGGAIREWVGVHTDITDQRAAEDNLRALNQTLEQRVAERTADRDRVWNLIPDLLMSGSLDGFILSANPAWMDVLGYDEDWLKARPFWEIIHPDFLDASARAVAEMKAGRTARHRNRVRAASGEYRDLDWVSTPAGDLFYAAARDVTAEREAAAELERTQEALRQSQKMEAVGQLTGGIAHDFNNMLAIVIGSLDLLNRRLREEDARARRHVASAMEGARRAATLTQRLLAFSRQQPLQPVTVDVNKLVAGMSELLRRSLGEGVRLETVLAGGLWRTHADPHGIESAILNLAVNARDAMALEGGRLTIETQNAFLDERYAAHHYGIPTGQYVLVAVTDTGSGMTPEVLAKAFDPFFTTKEVGRGTGLGLSMVYGFVKQSGGHVKIYSEPGQGTTVKIYLPRQAETEAGVLEAGDAVDLPLAEHEVVLVVEDEEAVRRVSVEVLRELGYEVLEADGAAAALRILEATPEIALLFTDVMMPEMNGRELADRARALRPDLRVLFTTGYTRNAVVHNGVLDPGVSLLGKPFTVEALALKVREVLERP